MSVKGTACFNSQTLLLPRSRWVFGTVLIVQLIRCERPPGHLKFYSTDNLSDFSKISTRKSCFLLEFLECLPYKFFLSGLLGTYLWCFRWSLKPYLFHYCGSLWKKCNGSDFLWLVSYYPAADNSAFYWVLIISIGIGLSSRWLHSCFCSLENLSVLILTTQKRSKLDWTVFDL